MIGYFIGRPMVQFVSDPAAFRDNAEVAAMPCYPADGSIRIIDGAVVVKLS